MVTILLRFHPTTFMFSPVLPLIPPVGISPTPLRRAHRDALCRGGCKDRGEAVSSWRAASSASLCLSISMHHSPVLSNPSVPWVEGNAPSVCMCPALLVMPSWVPCGAGWALCNVDVNDMKWWSSRLERLHWVLAGACFLLQLVKDFLPKGSCEGNACYCKQIHPMGLCQFC